MLKNDSKMNQTFSNFSFAKEERLTELQKIFGKPHYQ